VQTFVEIGQSVAEISRFVELSNMAAIRHRHLGFVVRVFGPPKKSIWCLYYCAKFSCNQCSNFDNMRVIYLTSLA